MQFPIEWKGFPKSEKDVLAAYWAENEDFPEWFCTKFSGKVYYGDGKDAGASIQANDLKALIGRQHYSTEIGYSSLPDMIDILSRFVSDVCATLDKIRLSQS